MKRNQQDFRTEKYIRYGIRKYSFGAASVAIAAGLMFLGTGVVAAAETQSEQNTDTALVAPAHTSNQLESEKEEVSPVSDDTHAPVDKEAVTGTAPIKADEKQTVTPTTEESTKPQETEKKEDVKPSTVQEVETKEEAKADVSHSIENKDVKETSLKNEKNPSLNLSSLKEKLAGLESQIERIQGNAKQAAHISNAEKLASEAKRFLESLDTTQQEVDAKAKEISSLTSILKSIKAEETVKENKNQDSRNGKKMQEGVGFRTDTAAGTGVGADVVDATAKPYNPNIVRTDYTNAETSAGMLNQVSWLDFSNLADWQNVKMLPNGNMALQEGSVYTKEIMKDYIVKITVKSLKPFQSTEIYKKRMEAAGATEEEKATYDPTARNWYMKDRGSGAGDYREEVNIIAKAMDQWTEIKKAGVDTGTRKTTIKAESVAYSIGAQFEISGTYRGKPVRPAVVMTDGESANPGESVLFTTNGTGWQLISEVKQNRGDARHYTPVDMENANYSTYGERYGSVDTGNHRALIDHGVEQGKGYGPDNKKIAYKYLSSPDQETGGLGSGVFGPITNAGPNSTPVVMTKDATEIGMYIVSDGHQAAMLGFVPVDSGDAPATYGEATHTLTTISSFDGSEVKQPYLGSVRPDMDTSNEKNWLGDDTKEEADEGIDQILPDNLKGQTNQVIKMNRERQGSYTLQVQAHTGGAPEAHIYGWIDFNHNGTFEENERSDLATITKDGPVTLQFNNNIAVDDPSLVELGTRVRISTSSKAIEQPTGIAATGEVEDFKTQITHPPVGEKKTTEGLAKQTQRESIHFTARGKTSYDFNTDTSIDTNTPPVYIDNKTGQEITLSADGTYTVAGQGTYKFTVADNKIDVNVEFTPEDGFVGEAHGITLRRQDTNGATTDWISKDIAATPVVNDVRQSMDGLYIPKVTVPTSVNATPVNADSQNLQGLPQKGKPTFNVESAKEPVTASAKHPAKLVDPRTNTVTELTTVDAFEQGTTNKIGTYTIVPETGEITFTPNKDFKGIPAPATISADVELTHDKDGNVTTKTLTATYTPTIIPVAPTATPSETVDIQGAEQSKEVTFTAGKATVNGEEVEVPMNNNEYKLLGEDGQPAESVPAKNPAGEVIGTYTLKVVDGKPTAVFTPTNKLYSGEVKPVTIQGKDTNGTAVTTTYTPRITPVTPTAEKSETSDVQGKVQTSPIKLDTEETGDDKGKTVNFDKGTQTGPKGERVELDPETLTLLNEAGEEVTSVTTPQGKYELDKANKTISFTPNKDFVGTATPVKVQIKDVNGTKVETTYTPTVTDVTMESVDKTSEAPQGQTQTGKPEFTISSPNVQITGYKLVDPVSKTPVDGTEIEVPEQGTYKIDKTTGQVTFIPKPGYTGTTDGITVQATDENGETKDAKYTPTVNPFIIIAVSQESKNIQGVPQEGTPTFTIPEDATNASITSRKLVDPSDNTPKDSVTIEGKGTFVIDETGKVTFTPVPSYTGDVPAIEVKATVTVTNEKNETATITQTATYKPEIVPVELGKTPATSTNLQGLEQKGTPTFTGSTVEVNGEQKEVTIKENSYTLVKDGAEVTTTPAYKKGTTDVIGTYTIDPATGEVTLTPTDKTYTGEVEPAVVQATGSNNVKVQTTYTPTITPVTPTAEKSETSDVQGKVQTSPIKLDTEETGDDKGKTVNFDKGTQTGPKGERVELDPETLTLLNEAGEEVTSVTTPQGKYELDKANKTISFTPNKDFVGTATPVKVQIKDVNGTKVETTYTPTVTDVTMESVDKTSEAPQGQTQTGKPEFTISSPNVQITGYKLVDPVSKTPVDGTEIEVPEQGTYKIDKTTGQVTFIPKPGYTGTTDGITVQATDENGETKDAKYTPKVTPLTVTPENKTSKNIQGVPQEGTPTFTIPEGVTNASITSRKLVDPLDNTPKDSVTVEGKGTFVIDETGKVTFTPVPSYTGDVPAIEVEATVTVTNEKNEPATITSKATYTPEIVPVKPTAESSTTSDVQGKVQTSSIVLDTEETGDDKGKTVNFNKGIEQGPKGERTELNPDTLTLLNEAGEEVTSVTTPQGKYELDKANKTITFTPNKDFAGEATPVKVQIKDANGTKVETTYTPTVIEVTMEGTPKETEAPQGKTQTGKPEFTISSPDIRITGYKLINPTTNTPVEDEEIDVPEQGTYRIDKTTGQVTFIPKAGFTGPATGITVQATDENGETKDAKYTPKVTPLTVTPENKTSKNIQGVPQEGTPTFTIPEGVTNASITSRKLVDPTDNTPKDSVTVEGKGTFIIDETGKVTFTPVPSYTGEVPAIEVQATVTVTNEKNEPATITSTATYKPEIVPVKPTAEASTTSDVQGKPQTSSIVLDTEETGDDKGKTVNFNKGIEQGPKGERTELNPDTLTLLNEAGEEVTSVTTPQGKYELDKANKTITFTPNKDFAGEATPVKVQIKDANGTKVETTYTPTVIEVTPTGENAATEGPKAQPQTSTIVFDKKDEDNSTVNFNKGHENVALDPTTTTLVGKDGSPTTEVKVPGEGTYTLVNNVITFTPEPEFAGKATGVSVQVKDANGTVVTKTYTPTVRPVTTFVDEAGNPITVDKNNTPVVPEEDGTKPTKDIYGYKFIRVELDNKGNTKHIYEPAKGESVKVSYVSTTGEVLKDSQTVKPKDTLVGTTYDASTETIKSERIEKDGKVYLLKERKADSASEKGKVSDKEQTITYVYEEVKESEPKRNYGSVVVLYTDKFGRPISGVTETGKEVGSTVLDTPNAPLNTKYDTTDNRPQTITTKDGKVYTLKKVTKNSDAEQSGVKGRTSVVTYVYEILNNTEEFPEAHIGVVLVNYLDEEGNPISGKTPEGQEVPNVVVDTDAALVDTEYDTTDNKPSVIVAENGDVYELVKASETSVEKGKVVEGATIVDYVYRKVVTTFVDEEGKEINPSDKGTKDKKDVPEYIFKETKKDEKGNTIHVYQKVTTTYVDEEGKEINPSDKGTKGNKEIPEYIFKETKKDEKGNTIHVYQKVSTTYVDEEGKEINPSDRGTKANKDISGYTFKETKKDEKGNTIHVYQKVTSSNPSTSTPSIDSVLTTFVDENGNVIIHEENGSHPGREIEGYELIGIKRDSRGNVRNIYRKIPTSTTGLASTSEQSVQSLTEVKKELPNTGTVTNASLATLGLLGLLSGFGLVARKKKED